MKIAGIILAAGRSSRFEDGNKLLADIDGIPIVRHVCLALAASNLDDIVLVTSETYGPVSRAAGSGRWRVVVNADAADGLSTSLRAALATVDTTADSVLVALADMPGVTTGMVNKLLSEVSSNPESIVFPIAEDGSRGHPVIWPKSLFPALARVTGDVGGKAILEDHADLWRPILWENSGAFTDIDTRRDFAEFRRSQAERDDR